MNYFLNIVLLVLCLTAQLSQAQNLVFSNNLRLDNITIEQGLPGISAHAFLQDKLGRLWIGTFSGLVRYDGINFTTFKHHAQKPEGLKDNYISCLFEDKDGYIWIGSLFSGLSRYDPFTNQFTHFPTKPETLENALIWRYVSTINQDKLGNIWVGTMNGLSKIELTNVEGRDSFLFTSFYPTLYPEDFFVDIKKYTRQSALAQLLQVGNNTNLTKPFELQENQTVLVVAMGEYEGRGKWADKGWLENENGQKVWEMSLDKSFQDGANYKKRIQAALLTLPKGKYQLHFQSDEDFSFNNFYYPKEIRPYNASNKIELPEHDSLWGIQVMSLEDTALEKTKQLLDKLNGQNSISNGRIYTSFRDQTGELWLGTALGLNQIILPENEEQNILFEHHFASTPVNQLQSDIITQIQQSNENTLLLTGLAYKNEDKSYGVHLEKYQTQRQTAQAIYYNPEITNYTQVLELPNRNFWLGSYSDGLFQLIKNEGNQSQSFYTQSYSLPSKYAWRLFQDATGTIWLGTYRGGAFKLNSSVNRFQFYRLSDLENQKKDWVIQTVLEGSNGSFWFGLDEAGLLRWQKETNTFTHYNENDGLSHNNVMSLAEGDDGNIWIGTEFGLSRFNLSENRFYNYFSQSNNPNSLSSHEQITGLEVDNQGNVWIGSKGGLHLYQESSNDFRYISFEDYLPDLQLPKINTIKADPSGNLWIGTYFRGLLKIPIQPLLDNAPTISTELYFPDEDIFDFQTQGEDIWFIDGQTGFFHYNINTKERKIYTQEEGLSHEIISSIVQDNSGNFWLNTSNGVSKFEPESETFSNYSKEDGIEFKVNLSGRAALTKNGKLLTGGINGFYRFHPDSIQPRPYAPKVALVDLKINNKSVQTENILPLEKSIAYINAIALNYDQNALAIEYAGLHYDLPQQIIYSYQLEGADQDWLEVGQERIARYANLPPGTYVFKVKAAYKNEQWSEASQLLSIIIHPPWWRTSWFYASLLILFGFGLYRGYRFQFKRQMEQKEAIRLKEMDELKNRFFVNVSHELRTPLTLILGPLGIILKRKNLDENTKDNLGLMQQNGKKLLNLINEILDLSKLEAGKLALKEKPVSLFHLLTRITSAFESGAQFRQIQLSFHANFNRQLKVLVDVSKLEKILYNLIINALKFTPKGGEVSLAASDLDDTIEITVKDTGSGIHPDDLPHIFDRFYQSQKPNENTVGGTGVGLALSRQLTQLMGGELSVESTLGKGSIFRLVLPKKEVYGAAETELSENWTVVSSEEQNKLSRSYKNRIVNPTKVTSNRITILVVEDNPDMQQFIYSILSKKYNVRLADNGQDALEQLTVDGGRWTADGREQVVDSQVMIDHKNETDDKNQPHNSKQETGDTQSSATRRSPSAVRRLPSLIISDVMMPVMDGFTLLEQLKTSDEWRSIPVIMLTARTEKEARMRALRIGVDDYLSKPFEQEELLVRIKNLLKNYKNRQESIAEDTVGEASAQTDNQTANTPVTPPASKQPSTSKKAKPSRVSKEEALWLESFEQQVKNQLANSQMTVLSLAFDLHISERQLYRKIKQLTGLSPNKYIQEVRLQTARQLLENQECSTVKEACYSVGFKKVRYFSELFNKRFGKNPSEFL